MGRPLSSMEEFSWAIVAAGGDVPEGLGFRV